ncbi:MAG TPA: SRPBCC family protein [Streptosporangiaceae bacterium]|nr:SRPBCC family protein [Streptosporangiaceae bacterium]
MNGTFMTVAGRPTLRFERRLRHPVEKVWRAVTEPAELEHWFPQRVEGVTSADGTPFVPGGKLRFPFREAKELDGEMIPDFEGEVLDVEPPRLLSFTWAGDVLRFELIPDGDGCLLVFTDTFTERGKAARDGAGWHVCLDGLEASLDGTAPPEAGRWPGLYENYAVAFGPEAATAPIPKDA